MTSFVIRHRDQRRRERMIDEAVREAKRYWPITFEYLARHDSVRAFGTVAAADFLWTVRAEFRRLASR